MSISRVAFGVAAIMLMASPAFACKGQKVQFSDDFRQVDDSWNVDPTDIVSVEEGKLKLKAKPDSSFTVLYGGVLFDDADACVTVRVPKNATDMKYPAGGIVFWAQDYSNYYGLFVSGDGAAALERMSKNKWIPVVAWKKFGSVKSGPGAENVLRVTTHGALVTAYINDTKFASVRGQPPDGGGQIGLHAESEPNQTDTWKFTALKVTDLPTQ